jgi:hypothetical protein
VTPKHEKHLSMAIFYYRYDSNGINGVLERWNNGGFKIYLSITPSFHPSRSPGIEKTAIVSYIF